MSVVHQDDNAITASEFKHAETEKSGFHSDSEPEQDLGGIYDGLEFPTEEEKRTLRRVADAIPWAAYCQ